MNSSAPASPHSASISENSGTAPFAQAQPKPQVDAHASNGVEDAQDQKPEILNEFLDFESIEDNEKYMKYEADYARRLMAKYFAKKDIYGGNIYEETIIISGQIIKSSRWPCTRSYADPVQAFEDISSGSSSPEETLFHISNKKHISKSG